MVHERILEYNTYAATTANHTTSVNINIRWFPPTLNQYKLNIDGSFSTNNDLYGFGEIMRDFTSAWKVDYYNKSSSHCHTMVVLEGFLHGLALAKCFKFTPLIIETDSVKIIHLLQHRPRLLLILSLTAG